jgi:rod shape-determining protein MreC
VHDKQVRRRRAALALLVGVSLILLTAYFGESPTSPLHSVQRGIVEVLSPVQEGASKVLSPVRDVAGWVSDTLRAKSRVDKLQSEVDQLRQQNDALQLAQIQNQELKKEVGLDDSISGGINSYHPVAASVISRDPILWYQTIEVDKGSDDGVALNDPVIGYGALVGKVTTLDANVSVVTLITDHSYAVAALVLDGHGDSGVLVPAVGNPNQLLLQDLPSTAPITPGQQVVTAGFADPSNPAVDSLYPPGLPIGQVSSFSQNELLNSNQVPVSPGGNLRHLSVVQILTRPHPGDVRAQVP